MLSPVRSQTAGLVIQMNSDELWFVHFFFSCLPMAALASPGPILAGGLSFNFVGLRVYLDLVGSVGQVGGGTFRAECALRFNPVQLPGLRTIP